jgi:hypothetical protein
MAFLHIYPFQIKTTKDKTIAVEMAGIAATKYLAKPLPYHQASKNITNDLHILPGLLKIKQTPKDCVIF